MPVLRRTTAVLAVGAALTAVLLAGCSALDTGPLPGRPVVASGLPDGWRWESYRDAELAVPGSWGYFNDSNCEFPADGGVGRPGLSDMLFCDDSADASRQTFVAFYPWFERRKVFRLVGDRTALRVGSAFIHVQAEPELRRRILATARRIDTNAYGCGVRDGISQRPASPPTPAIPVPQLVGVRSVVACRYEIDDSLRDGAWLKSTLRLTGHRAVAAVRAVARSPKGGGPDECCSPTPASRYGDEVVALLVQSARGPSRLHLRFSGEVGNGFDDGFAVRRLTYANILWFLAPPNDVDHVYRGREKAPPVLGPPPSVLGKGPAGRGVRK